MQIEPAFHTYGGGPRHAAVRIDLKAPEGKEAFLRLASGPTW